MSDQASAKAFPTRPPRPTKSGAHPAVKAYRAKLESMVDGIVHDAERLGQDASDMLESVRTPPPPKP
jgi:hypothetical protein